MILGLLDEEALICLGTDRAVNTASDFDQIMRLISSMIESHFYTSSAHSVFVDYHDKMAAVLEAGQQSGEFRQDISTRVFRNLVMRSLANLYNRWYYRDPISPLIITLRFTSTLSFCIGR